MLPLPLHSALWPGPQQPTRKPVLPRAAAWQTVKGSEAVATGRQFKPFCKMIYFIYQQHGVRKAQL